MVSFKSLQKVYKNRERRIQAVGINQLDEIMTLIRIFSGCLSLKN